MTATKRNKIIYWIATVWLSLSMTSSGILQLMQHETQIEMMGILQYPIYLLTIIGILKIPGVIVLLMPGLPLLKEWAYAGFFFLMVGAALSHVFTNDFANVAPSLIVLVLIAISWFFRPANRKLVKTTEKEQ